MENTFGIWDGDSEKGTIIIGQSVLPPVGLPSIEGVQSVADLLQHVHPEDIGRLTDAVGVLQARKSSALVCDFRISAGNGDWIWIQATGRIDRRGKKLSGVWCDISARKAADIRKDEAVSRVHQFAAAASHDLIGPLRHIAMYGDLLLSDFGTDATTDTRQMLSAVAEKARHLQVLTKRLIAFSTGASAPEFKAVLLDDVVGRLGSALSKRLDEAGVTVTTSSLPTVIGDPVLIEKVFENLIANALEWSGTNPPVITITGTTRGRQAVIEVSDNGIGIDPRYAARIFDAFWSLPHGAGDKGAGLGLAVCKTILHALEGTITLKASTAAGSTFEITLPAST